MSTKKAKQAPTPSDQLLDVEGAAAYLGLTGKSVRRRVLDRTIPFYKVGRLLRFKRADLDAWLEANRFEPEGK